MKNYISTIFTKCTNGAKPNKTASGLINVIKKEGSWTWLTKVCILTIQNRSLHHLKFSSKVHHFNLDKPFLKAKCYTETVKFVPGGHG
ncbi:hypothetical protein L3X38_022650 [Prunus dulcis]|uniref:Uncharacterized protein n=1 Tax=Prunus dulcis TaxID=3755 RepID=A0AAD4VYW6_PRUDU|nr:hypothetical protein L3X38_022650 [Prunus dulcis]